LIIDKQRQMDTNYIMVRGTKYIPVDSNAPSPYELEVASAASTQGAHTPSKIEQEEPMQTSEKTASQPSAASANTDQHEPSAQETARYVFYILGGVIATIMMVRTALSVSNFPC
jgi:hypothetical protein